MPVRAAKACTPPLDGRASTGQVNGAIHANSASASRVSGPGACRLPVRSNEPPAPSNPRRRRVEPPHCPATCATVSAYYSTTVSHMRSGHVWPASACPQLRTAPTANAQRHMHTPATSQTQLRSTGTCDPHRRPALRHLLAAVSPCLLLFAHPCNTLILPASRTTSATPPLPAPACPRIRALR